MKTNQIITRKIGELDLAQRTKDGMFNATSILKQWNFSSSIKKDMNDFLANSATKKIVDTIMLKESYMFKSYVIESSRARSDRGGGTWMHPTIFKYFLLWLDVRIAVCLLDGIDIDTVSYHKDLLKNVDKQYKTYMMLDSNTGYVKIGRSKNPNFRERTLQSEKPTIKMIYILDKDVEKEIHEQYKDARVRGEWFNISINKITGIANDYNFKRVI